MTEQAPNAHLTAAIWHWDVYYQAAIETAMTCGGAENFVTEMAATPTTPACPRASWTPPP